MYVDILRNAISEYQFPKFSITGVFEFNNALLSNSLIKFMSLFAETLYQRLIGCSRKNDLFVFRYIHA